MNPNNPKIKAFLRLGDEIYCGLKPKQFVEGYDPGELLHRKTMDIMTNPPSFDEYGRPLTHVMNYTEAFEMVCKQNPELSARYIQQLEEIKYCNITQTLLR